MRKQMIESAAYEVATQVRAVEDSIDTTLAEIAETRPRSVPDLARVSGLGPAKIERYGATLLDIVARSGD